MPMREWWALATVLVCTLAAVALWRWHEHEATGRRQLQSLTLQAEELGHQLNLLIVGVNRVLGLSLDTPAPDAGMVSVPGNDRQLRTLVDASVAIQDLWILNADGSVLATSSEAAYSSPLVAQPCYARARSQPAANMVFACAPFRDRAGAWSAVVLRARQDSSDTFDGVVAATLDLGYLSTTLPSALYAPDMRAFLLDPGGVIIASSHTARGSTGTALPVAPNSIFGRYLASGETDLSIEGSLQGGSERLVAFHSLQPVGLQLDQPLLLTVSRSADAAYHDWYLVTWLCGAAWLLTAGASSFALYRVRRLRVARAGAASSLRRQRLAELERIELIVGGADLSLWVWYPRERRLEVDERWCRMVGCRADDLVAAALTWASRVHPDAQATLDAAARQMMSGGVVEFEYRLRHDDGHWVWLLSRGKVVERDPTGRPVRLAGTHIDITERKRIEQALRLSEESLSTTLQSIGDAVIATDADGLITRMNPTAEALTGWPAAEALGQPLGVVFRIVDGRTRAPSVDPVQRVLAHGEIVGLANGTLLLSRDGSERQISDSAAPIRNPAGAITGVVLVFSDVTEGYRIQQALRDSELQMRLVTNAMPAAIGRFDRELRFLFANLAFEQVLGRPASDIVGRSYGELFGAAALAKVAPHVRRIEAGERVTFEEIFDTPKLGRRQAVVTMVPDFGADGQVRGHFSITTDVTEIRSLEEHLRESQKMDSIGTLAGGIAHDFNNVLGAVIGNAELALERLAPGHPSRQNLEQVRRASQRARGLVQQILTFSRRQPEQLVTLPLQPLVEETLEILRSTLPARIELAAEIDDTPLYANADAGQIQQVLMNLGTNAWHALTGEPGRIVVGIESVTLGGVAQADGSIAANVPGLEGGQYAHLWVSDDGVGIDPANRHRIFEPFFTTKAIGQGTGLGLSVVHGIVRTHLGAITVETALAEGTTFHVYLPASQRPSQVGALDEAASAPLRGRGQHVMYVDDDEVMRVMVDEMLAQAGYRVTSCRDAKTALAAFIDDPRAFDLVVTDYNMPDFTGLELAEKLTLIRPGLPMVISSGYVSDDLRKGAQAAGILHVLQKQNTFEELASLVHEALAIADASRESTVP